LNLKIQVVILIIIIILLAACAPETPTQESEVIEAVVTEAPMTEEPITQEPAITEEPVPTEASAEVLTEPPLACVTLLTPINGADIPPVGKVTFSWTPMDEAGKYVLNITLPSGEIAPFETDRTFRDCYMEAFVAGGEYQWQVVAEDADGSEICISEMATFDKPAYENPKDGSGSNDESNGGGGGPPPDPGDPNTGT
jgi:hypothetical protein